MNPVRTLPPQFEALAPYMDWALPTTQERILKRAGSSREQILAFHAAAAPHIDSIVEYLNQYPLDAIPADAQGLFDLMLAIADVGLYAEWLDGAPEPPIAPGLSTRITMIWEPGVRKSIR